MAQKHVNVQGGSSASPACFLKSGLESACELGKTDNKIEFQDWVLAVLVDVCYSNLEISIGKRMMIKESSVVSMKYTLKDQFGTVLDSSGSESFTFIQGQNNIIPGLEKALMGLNVGDTKSVEISPDEGYGQYNPDLRFSLNLEQFGGERPQPGMTVQLSVDGNSESFMAQIVEIQGDQVLLDANHPLAGKSLFFDVEIQSIREASAEELSHGHAHGLGGCHH